MSHSTESTKEPVGSFDTKQNTNFTDANQSTVVHGKYIPGGCNKPTPPCPPNKLLKRINPTFKNKETSNILRLIYQHHKGPRLEFFYSKNVKPCVNVQELVKNNPIFSLSDSTYRHTQCKIKSPEHPYYNDLSISTYVNTNNKRTTYDIIQSFISQLDKGQLPNELLSCGEGVPIGDFSIRIIGNYPFASRFWREMLRTVKYKVEHLHIHKVRFAYINVPSHLTQDLKQGFIVVPIGLTQDVNKVFGKVADAMTDEISYFIRTGYRL